MLKIISLLNHCNILEDDQPEDRDSFNVLVFFLFLLDHGFLFDHFCKSCLFLIRQKATCIHPQLLYWCHSPNLTLLGYRWVSSRLTILSFPVIIRLDQVN